MNAKKHLVKGRLMKICSVILPWIMIAVLVSLSNEVVAQSLPNVSVFGLPSDQTNQLKTQYAASFQNIGQIANKDDQSASADRLALMIKEDLALAFAELVVFSDYVGNTYFILDVVTKEDSLARLNFNDDNEVDYEDPDQLLTKWVEYEKLSYQLFFNDELEDISCPVVHCVWSFNHPKLKPYLEYFQEKVPENQELLTKILLNANNNSYRSSAAFLLAHATYSYDELVQVLTPALDDPSNAVRNNSLRVIYQILKADNKIPIDVNQVIRVLNYPSTTDRNKAIVVLRTIEASALTRDQIKAAAPVLIKCLEERDNNAGNALKVLRKLSGTDYEQSEVKLWYDWIERL